MLDRSSPRRSLPIFPVRSRVTFSGIVGGIKCACDGLMLRAAWQLLRASGHVLLEGTPESVDLEEVRRHVLEVPEVVSVHDLHAWRLTSDLPVISAHVVVSDGCVLASTMGKVLDHLQD